MKTTLAAVTLASEKWLIPIGRLQVDDLLAARRELIRHRLSIYGMPVTRIEVSLSANTFGT